MSPVHLTAGFTPEAAFAYLGLATTSSPEECREAYLKLARQLHPDVKRSINSSSEAILQRNQDDHGSFQRLQAAYKVASEAAKKTLHQSSVHQTEELPEPVIRHRAPQHRRFLEAESRLGNSGPIAAGLCPADRYRQMQTQRFAEAAYASADYRVARICAEVTPEKSISIRRSQNQDQQNKFKSVNFIERVADELIQEAMERGEFDQLPGQGKPLPQETHTSLFGDPSTTKITRILVNQGYLPEWVQLGKELRERWGKAVANVSRINNTSQSDDLVSPAKRAAIIQKFREEAAEINRLIDRYNLLVPVLHLQRGHKNPDWVIEKLLIEDSEKQTPSSPPEDPTPSIRNKSVKRVKPPVPTSQGNDETSDTGNLFDPRYLAEIMRDFYRELARAYVSMMRGFKNHK